ncbi:MAG: hypothetical protein LBE59_02115 [Nevskiaceae bacterium]|jgi:hypothetical protein|nr:hypothetical protein [Nevskiaceae bacterium]
MADSITIDDALRVGQGVGAPADNNRQRPITFDEALAERTANTRNVVDVERLQRAQAYDELSKTDPYYAKPITQQDPDGVPIDNYMQTIAPPLQPARGGGFGAALKSAIPADMQTRRRVLAENLFPDDPQGITRVGFIDDKPVYVDENGQLRLATGGFGRFAAGVISNGPEIVSGIAGSFATGNPLSGSAIGAAGGRGIKRGVSQLVFDEPATAGSVLGEMAVEGVTDLAGGAIGKGSSTLVDSGRIVDFTPGNARAAEVTRDRLKQSTGIDLDLAQASGNSKLIAIRAYAARFPGKSAELLQAADEAANGQFEAAINRTMDSIARAAPAEVFGTKGVGAARMVIEAAKESRDQAVRPLYEAAGQVSLAADVVKSLQADPALKWVAGRVQRDPVLQRGLQGKGEDSLAFWHLVQQDIDDQIAKALKGSENNKARILTQARDDLSQKLEAASPEFAQAQAAYARMTRESIEPLEDSAVGVLARITNPKAATAAARIFADQSVTAAEIRATRASIVRQQGGEDAWNGLVRQWVASRWNKALRETQTGGAVNPAGKLRQALIGTPQDKDKIAAMLPPGSVQAFDDLMEVAQAMARTPNAGSNTMRDLEIAGQLKGATGAGLTALRWFTSPIQSIRDAGEQKAVERGTLALAQAILDPAKRTQLRQLVRMQLGTKQWIILAGLLTTKTGREWIDPSTELPEATSGTDPTRGY